MSLAHFRAALSFKKMDNPKAAVSVPSNPQQNSPTARTSTSRRSSVIGRNPVQRIGMLSLEYRDGTWAHYPAGNRRASVRSNISVRRVSRLPQLGVESSQGACSISPSNESGDLLNHYNSGYFYGGDEAERSEPSVFNPHSSRQPTIRRCVQSGHALRPPDPVIGELQSLKSRPSSLVSLPV